PAPECFGRFGGVIQGVHSGLDAKAGSLRGKAYTFTILALVRGSRQFMAPGDRAMPFRSGYLIDSQPVLLNNYLCSPPNVPKMERTHVRGVAERPEPGSAHDPDGRGSGLLDRLCDLYGAGAD